MIVHRRWPHPRVDIDLQSVDGREILRSWYEVPSGPSLRVNLVVSDRGDTVGPDGTSTPLSSSVDRTLLRELRLLADAVIVGAGTVRSERIPVPLHGPLVVLSRSGNTEGFQIVPRREGTSPVVLVTPRNTVPPDAVPGIELSSILVSDAGMNNPGHLRAVLHEKLGDALLLEGGPRTIRPFAEGGWVDELCLTSPDEIVESPVSALSWWPESQRRWHPVHRLESESGEWFHRFSAR